jgi:hypothetical protein
MDVTVDDFRSQDEWICSSRFGWYRLVKSQYNTWVVYIPTGPDEWTPDSEYDHLEDAIADLGLNPEY